MRCALEEVHSLYGDDRIRADLEISKILTVQLLEREMTSVLPEEPDEATLTEQACDFLC